jgi:hypothetical protein
MSEENFCVKSQQFYLSFNEDRNADWLHIVHLLHELGEQATRRLRLVEKWCSEEVESSSALRVPRTDQLGHGLAT